MEIGLASGLGRTDGIKIGLGISDLNEVKGYYGNVIIPIKKQFLLEAYYSDTFASGLNQWNVLNIGFHYRFGNS